MLLYFQEKFQVKSKYLGSWNSRAIKIDTKNHLFGISQQKNYHDFKFFDLQHLKIQRKNNMILIIITKNQRKYQIKGSKIILLQSVLNQHLFPQDIKNQSTQYSIQTPKNIQAKTILKPIQNIQKTQIKPTIKQNLVKPQKQIVKIDKVYPRQKSYLIQKDWVLNSQNGGLLLISQTKKANQTKIIKYVLTKFITTGSFMGISFPVFAMKSQSILQTYCKSISTAPLIFQNCINNPIQRIKKFVTFIFAFSRLFTDLDKPFNPVLGQTFQANIGGGIYSAEQISHHPPLSAIYFQGKGYKMYAVLQLVAQIGINSANGHFYGDFTVQFQKGQKVIGRLLQGTMSGFLLGQNRFRPQGSCYAYDYNNKLVCTYQRSNKDIFKGYLGKLQPKFLDNFQRKLRSKQRFTDSFKAFKKSEYIEIISEVEANWSHNVKFTNKTYIDFDDKNWLPYNPTIQGINLLKSDSRYRKDIIYLRENKIEQSQKQKQKIQNLERSFHQLRTKQL